jgi:hypothetical protein
MCLLPALLFLLSGCFGSEDLLRAPRPAVQYRNLQTQIDALLANGYTYSVPAAGDDRQAVLMADLTGDGREEAVVLLRSETESMLRVFLPGDGDFTALPPVTENAESVHSVVFYDINGDGRREIIVGWQVAGRRFLSVYAIDGDALAEIFSRPFSGYTVYNMEGEGAAALILVRVDSAEQVVETVAERGGELVLTGTAYLSRGAEAVRRIRTGPLSDGSPGLYVASQYQTSEEVTDVFAFREGGPVNITANMETGVSEALVRQISVAAADINGDGILDLPRPIRLPRRPGEDESADPYYEIRWSAYDSNGLSVETARTYHSVNWYIVLPEQWPEHYAVRRSLVSVSQSVTTFSILEGGDEPVDFLKVYYVTQAAGGQPPVHGRTVLDSQDNLLVTAEIIPLKDRLARHNVGEQELKAMFHLITADWRGT